MKQTSNPPFSIFHAPFGGAQRHRAGFTLIELLVVISVIGILGTIIIGSSRMLLQTSRERRSKITRETLSVALQRYRTEYQCWPVSRQEASSQTKSKRENTNAYNGYYWYKWEKDNYEIFDALRVGNRQGNPDDIRFIDETSVYTAKGAGEAVTPLSSASGTTGHSLYYAMKRNNKAAPFIVWICFDTDECEVGPDSFDAGYINEEDKSYGY